MRRAYQSILKLYPYDFRDMFTAEMVSAFDEAIQERHSRGFAELIALLIGVIPEWIAKLTSDRCVRGRCLPDLRMMRPAGVSKESWFLSGRAKCWSDTSR
jgi:hypothetical protein